MATTVNLSTQQTTNLTTLATATGLTTDQVMDIALALFHKEYNRTSAITAANNLVLYTQNQSGTGTRQPFK